MTRRRALVFALSFLLSPLVIAQDAMGVKYVSPVVERSTTCWGRETAESMARRDLDNKASAMCRELPGKWLLNRKAITSESYGYMQCFPCKNSPGEFSCMIERSRMPCENLEKKKEDKPKESDAAAGAAKDQAGKAGAAEGSKSTPTDVRLRDQASTGRTVNDCTRSSLRKQSAAENALDGPASDSGCAPDQKVGDKSSHPQNQQSKNGLQQGVKQMAGKPGTSRENLSAMLDRDYDNKKAAGTHLDMLKRVAGAETPSVKSESRSERVADGAASRTEAATPKPRVETKLPDASSLNLSSGSGTQTKIELFNAGFTEDVGSYCLDTLRRVVSIVPLRMGHHDKTLIDNKEVSWKDRNSYVRLISTRVGQCRCDLRSAGHRRNECSVNGDLHDMMTARTWVIPYSNASVYEPELESHCKDSRYLPKPEKILGEAIQKKFDFPSWEANEDINFYKSLKDQLSSRKVSQTTSACSCFLTSPNGHQMIKDGVTTGGRSPPVYSCHRDYVFHFN